MQAVIKTGGKQYRVAEGDTLDVELLEASPGDEVDIEPIMLFEGKELVHDGGAVKARVVEHGKGKKLIVFKYKPKTGYRRKNGHRQQYSRIEITSISR
jgi:large subunit ribosomal protein L21